MVVGHAGQVDHVLALAAASDADVGLAGLTRAIDHTAEHRERHWGLDVAQRVLKLLHGADHVKALPRAAGARDDPNAAGPQPKRFEEFVANPHFFLRLGREADPDRVADPGPEQIAHANAGFDRPADQSASLGNPQVQRTIDRIGKPHIGCDREEHVAGFHGDLEFVEIVVLQQLDVIKRRLNQRLGAWLAVLFEQVLFKTSSIDPDPDRATVCLGCADHFCDPFAAADIARIDPQAGRAGIGRFERAFVVEMDVGHDRYLRRADDLAQRGSAFHIGA